MRPVYSILVSEAGMVVVEVFAVRINADNKSDNEVRKYVFIICMVSFSRII